MTEMTDIKIWQRNFFHPENTWPPNSGHGDMGDISNEKIYTGEFWISNSQDCRYTQHRIVPIKRESKDTFVFLKDYKLKIREINNNQKRDTSNLDNHIRHIHGEIKRERNLWRLEKEELDERIEKLERQIYDLLNPPIKPVLKNPFD